ncbi:BBOX1 [Branchiostoma lanceolatum]|uniref:BBOX1 protein n=1 Tax=Branchiostoma lanceolatum TaxID=7740 RepID=A0A8K0EGR9_BRALA|nr:BBOX1 [Branchiostoma lanceolatum]
MALSVHLLRPWQKLLVGSTASVMTSKWSRCSSVLSGNRVRMVEKSPNSTDPETSQGVCTIHGKQQQQATPISRAVFPPQAVFKRRFSALCGSSEVQEGALIMEKVCLNEAARMVEVEWSGGGVSRFPYVWLRDNCQCPQCFNPDSRSRLVLMLDLDVNVSPVRVEVQAGGSSLSVEWPDGHQSQYDRHWLRERCFSTQALSERQRDWHRKTQLWGAELAHNMPKADFPALLTDDRALYDFLVRLDSVGLVLVQNVPCDVGQVEKLANRVAFLKHTCSGKEFVVMNKTKPGSDVAYTSVKLGLHTDLNSYTYKPGVQMLHCIEQTTGEGGDNSLVDGFNAASQLKEENPDAFRILTTVKVNFRHVGMDYHKYFHLKRRNVISLNDQEDIQSISYSDQSRTSILDLPADLVQPFYDALKAFNTIMCLPRNCLSLKMAAGELIVFDNNRTLHGRSAYSPDSGTRHLQGGYMDWDEIYSRMRAIKADLGIEA